LFSGYLKCSHCGSSLIIKRSKNQIYYYCSSYIKDKSCFKYSINKKKLEQMVRDEIIKKINIEQLDIKILNELIDMIYITDKNNMKIEFKNI
jgi:ssDNA-binding Zn-finger/Zn-ribbon topoisomerase 1